MLFMTKCLQISEEQRKKNVEICFVLVISGFQNSFISFISLAFLGVSNSKGREENLTPNL